MQLDNHHLNDDDKARIVNAILYLTDEISDNPLEDYGYVNPWDYVLLAEGIQMLEYDCSLNNQDWKLVLNTWASLDSEKMSAQY